MNILILNIVPVMYFFIAAKVKRFIYVSSLSYFEPVGIVVILISIAPMT